MLTGIQTATSARADREQTPVDLLLGCHDRIRHFTRMARRIAENPDAAPRQVSDAAEAVYRYFHEALPLHEADENLSIDPRLEEVAPNSALARAAADMVCQHGQINAVLSQLLPLWDALCREPEKLLEFMPRLLSLSTEFEALWDVHLRLEEKTVFPAIERSLSQEDVAAILAEMRARRRSETA